VPDLFIETFFSPLYSSSIEEDPFQNIFFPSPRFNSKVGKKYRVKKNQLPFGK
jgi:hypothetical protein